LGSTDGAELILEPDHPNTKPFAVRACRALGTRPVVASDERGPEQYRRLWDAAFGATTPRFVRGQGRLSKALFMHMSREVRTRACHPVHPHRTLRLWMASMLAVPLHARGDVPVRIVKSVRVHFALEWIRQNWNPVVVICRRHPLDVVASMVSIDSPLEHRRANVDLLAPAARALAQEWFGVPEPEGDDRVANTAWRAGMLMSVLDAHARRCPDLHVVDHELLCAAPRARLQELATSIGLLWGPESDEFVVAHERPGTGYEINRISSELPGAWRTRLTADEARTAARVLAQFPIAECYDLP
jgi:hypothetical protein